MHAPGKQSRRTMLDVTVGRFTDRWFPLTQYRIAAPDAIALTFDDGPCEPYTSSVLDILARFRVRATFFVIGEHVQRHPQLIRRMAHDGHSVGNHTYTHPDIASLGVRQLYREVSRCASEIRKTTGIQPRVFRPPYLSHTPKTDLIISAMRYRVVSASTDPVDWTSRIPLWDYRECAAHVAAGDIIMLHDGQERHPKKRYDRRHTVGELPGLIASLKRRGLRFVTLPQ